MAAIIRLKRKACDEPAEGLVIQLKKPKCELSDANEVLFKFAATLKSEEESVRDHIQAALSKDKKSKFSKWRDPKNTAISQNTIKQLSEKLRTEYKNASEKKKLDYLNNRRLILKEEFQNFEDFSSEDAKVRQLFHLYDISEENEETKIQVDEVESTITCNGQPLIREKVDDYVYDVYIADRYFDPAFVDGTVSVRPCMLTVDDIYFGGSDESEEIYDDEEDSNDENNWRNEYPEDESNSERDRDSDQSIGYEGDDDEDISYEREISDAINVFDLDDDHEEPFDYSRVLKDLKEEYDEFED